MLRFLTLTAFLAGALLFTHGAAQAQDQDLPVAGPDEIIFIGEVPAVPGTQVWAIYLAEGFVSCGTTEADDTSHFVLVVDASCTSFLGPVICWGGLPDWEDGQEEFCDGRRSSPLNVRPEAGDTVDVGMLLPRSEQPPRELDIGAPPHGDGILPMDDYPNEIDEPAAAPDEIIFVGEAPAPPGTEVTALYTPLVANSEVVVCGRTRLDDSSRFTLVVDATCAEGAVGPLICWGELREGPLRSGSCQGMSDGFLTIVDRSGRSFDVGLLAHREPPELFGGPPHGDRGPILPKVGGAVGGGDSSGIPWLVLVAALVLAGLVLSSVGKRMSGRRPR